MLNSKVKKIILGGCMLVMGGFFVWVLEDFAVMR